MTTAKVTVITAATVMATTATTTTMATATATMTSTTTSPPPLRSYSLVAMATMMATGTEDGA